MSASFELESSGDESLYSLVARAAEQAAGPDHAPVGRLDIVATDETTPTIAVEAAMAYSGVKRVIDVLDLSVTVEDGSAEADAAMVREAIEVFGGARYTNLCIDRDDGAELDVTVTFPSPLPFLAENTLIATGTTDAHANELGGLLRTLGVAYSREGHSLVGRHRQLRGTPTVDAQVRAFTAAGEAGFHTTLYSSAIPAHQSARIELQPIDGARRIDCRLSRGRGTDQPLGTTDADAMQSWLRRHFDTGFENRTWNVTNTVYDAIPESPPESGRRKAGVKFTFWVKGR